MAEDSGQAIDREALAEGESPEGGPDLEEVMHVIWDRLEGLEVRQKSARRAAVVQAVAIFLTGALVGRTLAHTPAAPAAALVRTVDARPYVLEPEAPAITATLPAAPDASADAKAAVRKPEFSEPAPESAPPPARRLAYSARRAAAPPVTVTTHATERPRARPGCWPGTLGCTGYGRAPLYGVGPDGD